MKECIYQEANNIFRDRLVIEMQNTNISEKLVNVGSDLTLEKAQGIAGLHGMPTTQATGDGKDSCIFGHKYIKSHRLKSK